MSRKVAGCGMLIALAMVFSYVEVLIPINFGIPGMKLGAANLVIVIGLYLLKPQEVLMISMIRIFLMGYMFGNGVSLLYSFAGGIVSFLLMAVIRKMKGFSVVGVSIIGGVSHNIGQLLAAAWIIRNRNLFYYLPALLAAGTATGALIGILSGKILHVVEREARKSVVRE